MAIVCVLLLMWPEAGLHFPLAVRVLSGPRPRVMVVETGACGLIAMRWGSDTEVTCHAQELVS
jgi:hypothetical protein